MAPANDAPRASPSITQTAKHEFKGQASCRKYSSDTIQNASLGTSRAPLKDWASQEKSGDHKLKTTWYPSCPFFPGGPCCPLSPGIPGSPGGPGGPAGQSEQTSWKQRGSRSNDPHLKLLCPRRVLDCFLTFRSRSERSAAFPWETKLVRKSSQSEKNQPLNRVYLLRLKQQFLHQEPFCSVFRYPCLDCCRLPGSGTFGLQCLLFYVCEGVCTCIQVWF